MKYVLLAFLLVAVVVGTYVGCGPRVGVAKDKALAKIDELLGPLTIKQKEVETAYEELKSATAEVRDKKIEAEVKVKGFAEKKANLVKDQNSTKDDLKQLRQMLSDAESDGFIERKGKKITIDELKSYANDYVQKLRLLNDKVAKNDIISAAWAKNFNVLKTQFETSSAQLKKLDSQLMEIRSKKSALDAMKQAASIAGPSTSISDKFNELTDSTNELIESIDTELAIEEVKLEERQLEMSDTPSIDELLDDKTDVSSTISDIDELLGGGDGQ